MNIIEKIASYLSQIENSEIRETYSSYRNSFRKELELARARMPAD